MAMTENASTKYNDLIRQIEELSRDPNETAVSIAERVSKAFGYSKRDMNTIMNFFFGRTLLDYIKERKMMTACKHMMDASEFDCDELLDIAGFDNQQSFTKCFTQTFRISPQKAFDAKMEALYQNAVFWDRISEVAIPARKSKEEKMPPKSHKFGMDRVDYERILMLQEQEALYGMPSDYSDIVYDLVMEYQIRNRDVRHVFAYVEEWYELFREDNADKPEQERVIQVKRNAMNRESVYMCLEVGLSVRLALRTLDRLPQDLSVMELAPPFLYELAHTDEMEYSYYLDAYGYFEDYLKESPGMYDERDSLKEYIDCLNCGMPKEEAIEHLVLDYSDCINEPDIPEVYDPLEEEMFSEELDWDGERFDIEPDMDNLAYEDD